MGRDWPRGLVDARTRSSTPSGDDRARVLLLDDHEVVRRGIKEVLGASPTS